MSSIRTILIGISVVGMLTTVSCSKNVFDEEKYKEIVEIVSPVDSVDHRHTWELTREYSYVVKADAGINAREVMILQDDPLTSTSSEVMAKGELSSGELTLRVTVPTRLTELYAALVDEDGLYTVVSFPVTASTVSFADVASSHKQKQVRAQIVPQQLMYCFEEEMPEPGDYDFNDVVLTVTPTIQGAAVKLKVSIDAVGATKSIGAAIRIVGVKPEDIVSFERIGNFDSNFPETGKIIINEDGGDRYNTDCLLPASTKCAAISNDVVIKLFSNAHWAILPQLSPTGTIRNWFFNTVAADDASAGDVNMLNGVEPKVVIYNFVMKDEATANKFVKDNLDAFIVEPYGAGFMEVHTIPWKTIEVLHEYANGNKDDYSDNYPWAICLPGNDFRYPREWWAITKAYQKSGHSFRRWAKYHTKAQDWYLYPTEEALYK